MPVARRERSIGLRIQSAGDACALATELYRRGLALSLIQLSRAGGDPKNGLLLEMGLAGSEAAVERSENEVASLARSLNAQPADAERSLNERFNSENFDDRSLLCRYSVLPSRLAALIRE